LKLSIIAEKFSKNLEQYVDIIVRMISVVGDFVGDEVANRMIQVVTGFGENKNEDLQKYACERLYNLIKNNPSVHMKTIRIAT